MSSTDLSISELIVGAKAGEQPALEDLLKHYRPYLRIIAAQAIGSAIGRREDGSDLAQQTCMEAVTAFPNFQGTTEPQLSAWLKQILRRNIANLIRDNRAAKRDVRREQAINQKQDSATLCWYEPEAGDTSPSENILKGEAALNLAAALEELPQDQRVAVAMRYLDGRSLAEIAKELGRTNSAVAGLLHRGLKALRSTLDLP